MECIICANIFNPSKSSDANFLGCRYGVCTNCSIKRLEKCYCGIIYNDAHNCSYRENIRQCHLLKETYLSEEVVYNNYLDSMMDNKVIIDNTYNNLINNNIDKSIQILNIHLTTIEIYAKTLTGKTIILKVPIKVNTIDPIKLLIYQKEKLPINYQRIIHNGHQYEDGRKYEFKKYMTLHLVLRLSGD